MNWLFAGELLCAGAVEGFACCRARPADWIGGRARRLAAAIGGRACRLAGLPWRDLLAAEPGQQTGSAGGPAGWPQRSAGGPAGWPQAAIGGRITEGGRRRWV